MKRRQFVFSAATFALSTGCGVLPNQGTTAAPRVARVGILSPSPVVDPLPNDQVAGLKQGLAELGYIDRQTIVFEQRDADSNYSRLPELANALIQLPVEVLVTVSGTPATSVAQQATTVVPIVFVGVTDPVGKGFVASLDHPGGNLTGVTNAALTVWGKLVEYLAQLAPRLSRVAFVTDLDPANPQLTPAGVQLTITAANALGVQVKFLDVRSAEDVEAALTEVLVWRAEAMMNFAGPLVAAPRLVQFQLQNRIPMAFSNKASVQAGGLLSYGVSNHGQGRTAATLVDKIILKGARPADLPVEQPTEYELIVNQTTARALGIAIPPEVAQQVTQWVQ